MKTKLTLTLLALTAISVETTHAEQLPANSPVGHFTSVQGPYQLQSNPPSGALPLATNVQPPFYLIGTGNGSITGDGGVDQLLGGDEDEASPPPPAISKLDQLDEASIEVILKSLLHGNDGDDTLHGDDGNDTLQDIAMWKALVTSPLPAQTPVGLWGDGGVDSITGDGGDDLYGGSGADTLVREMAHYVVTGFTCDPMEEDAITGDLGNDTFRPSNRMMRLQQAAWILGAPSDLRSISEAIARF